MVLGTTTVPTINHNPLTFIPFILNFIFGSSCPRVCCSIVFEMCNLQILETINHQPSSHKTRKLLPNPFRIFRIKGARLLVLASLGGVSVLPLPGRGSHPDQVTRWERPRTRPAAANSTTPWRKKNSVFSVVLFSACSFFLVCEVSTRKKKYTKK